MLASGSARSQRLLLYNPIDSSDSSDDDSVGGSHVEDGTGNVGWQEHHDAFSPGDSSDGGWVSPPGDDGSGLVLAGARRVKHDGHVAVTALVAPRRDVSIEEERESVLSWNSHRAELRQRVSAVHLRQLRSESARLTAAVQDSVPGEAGEFTACVWFGAIAVHSHSPDSDVEVGLTRGDVVMVMSYADDDWWYGKVLDGSGSGPEGWFPPSHLDAVEGIIAALGAIQGLPARGPAAGSPARLRRSITDANSALAARLQASSPYLDLAPAPTSIFQFDVPPAREVVAGQELAVVPTGVGQRATGNAVLESKASSPTSPSQEGGEWRGSPFQDRLAFPPAPWDIATSAAPGAPAPGALGSPARQEAASQPVASSHDQQAYGVQMGQQMAFSPRFPDTHAVEHVQSWSRPGDGQHSGANGVWEGQGSGMPMPDKLSAEVFRPQGMGSMPPQVTARPSAALAESGSSDGFFLDHTGAAVPRGSRAGLSPAAAAGRQLALTRRSFELSGGQAGSEQFVPAPSPYGQAGTYQGGRAVAPAAREGYGLPMAAFQAATSPHRSSGAWDGVSAGHGGGVGVGHVAGGAGPSFHHVSGGHLTGAGSGGQPAVHGSTSAAQAFTPAGGRGYGGFAVASPVFAPVLASSVAQAPGQALYTAAPKLSGPVGRIAVSMGSTGLQQPSVMPQASYSQPHGAGPGGYGPGPGGAGPGGYGPGPGGAGPGGYSPGPGGAGPGGYGPSSGMDPLATGPSAGGGGGYGGGYGLGLPESPRATQAPHGFGPLSHGAHVAGQGLQMGGPLAAQSQAGRGVPGQQGAGGDDMSLFGFGLDMPARAATGKTRRHSDISFGQARGRMEGSGDALVSAPGRGAGPSGGGEDPSAIYAALGLGRAAVGSARGGSGGGGSLLGHAGGISQRDASGRRVKVLTLSGGELWNIFRPLVLRRLVWGAGFMIRAGKEATRGRRAAKLFAVGVATSMLRKFAMGRRAARVWAAGMTAGGFGRRLGICHRKLAPVFAVGALCLDLRMRVAVEVGMLGPGGLVDLPHAHGTLSHVRHIHTAAVKKKKRTINTTRRGKKTKGAKTDEVEFDGVKTRNVHWDAISNVEGTMWDRGSSANLESNPELARRISVVDAGKLVPSLEATFAADSKATKKKKVGGPKKPKAITLLPAKAQQNISIGVMGSIGRMPLAKVADAIQNLDAAALGGPDVVASLADLDAYSEEVMAPMRAYTGDVTKLATAERYVKEVSLAVSQPKARLTVMEFVFSMDETKSAAVTKSGNLRKACAEVMGSKRFKTLLADVMLPLGNRLNAGSKKGMAAGIKLSSLNKLLTTRAATGETFLRFVVDGLMEMDEEEEEGGMTTNLLDVSEDMPTVLQVKHSSMAPAIVEMDVSRLKKGTNVASTLLKKAQEAGDADLVGKLEPIVEDATAALEEAARDLYQAVDDFDKMCKFVGEDAGRSSPEAVFGYVHRFLQQVSAEKAAAISRVQRKAKEEERKKSRDAMKAKQAGGKASKGTPSKDVKPKGGAPVLQPKGVQKLPPKPTPAGKPMAPPKPGAKPTPPVKPGRKPRTKRKSVLGGVGAQAPTKAEEKQMVGAVQSKMMAKLRRASMALIAVGALESEDAFFSGGDDDDETEGGGGAATGAGGRRPRVLSNIGEDEDEEEEEEEED